MIKAKKQELIIHTKESKAVVGLMKAVVNGLEEMEKASEGDLQFDEFKVSFKTKKGKEVKVCLQKAIIEDMKVKANKLENKDQAEIDPEIRELAFALKALYPIDESIKE